MSYHYDNPATVGWVPANPPKSGPPGPLVTGPLGAAPGLSDLFRSPLFIGAMALGAFVLWQSSKPKKRKRRRNPRTKGWPRKRTGIFVKGGDGTVRATRRQIQRLPNRDLVVYVHDRDRDRPRARLLTGAAKAQHLTHVRRRNRRVLKYRKRK